MSRSKSRRAAANQTVKPDGQPAPDTAPESTTDPDPRPTPYRRGRPNSPANTGGQTPDTTGDPAPTALQPSVTEDDELFTHPDGANNAGRKSFWVPSDDEQTAQASEVNKAQSDSQDNGGHVQPDLEKDKRKKRGKPADGLSKRAKILAGVGFLVAVILTVAACMTSGSQGASNTSNSTVVSSVAPTSTTAPATSTTAPPTTTTAAPATTAPTTTRRAASGSTGSSSGSSGSNTSGSTGVKLATKTQYVAYNASKGSGASGPAISCDKTSLVNAAVTRARTDSLWFAEKAWMFDHGVNDPAKVNYAQVNDLATQYEAHHDKWTADIKRLEDHVYRATVVTYTGGYNKTVMTTQKDGSRPALSNLYVDNANMGCTLVTTYDKVGGFQIFQSAKGGLQFRHLASKPAAQQQTTTPQPVFSTSATPTPTHTAAPTTTVHPTTAHPTTTVTTTTTARPTTTTTHAGPFSEPTTTSGAH